ncbi:hypothetical protein HCN44_000256 [Aphidius gifuensis]|uniref:chitinase n=1 Tax=Aphidius gifuensis TaxID=684658 RepID=A0A834XTD9_APHGI|nr:hypothetical protein HCN44_000256 [Aphidius gifuensis]
MYYWKTGGMAFALWLAILLAGLEYGNAEQRVVCYYTNWSVYRPGTAKYSPQNINPYLCTHLIYAFGGFTKENTLKPFDKYQDIEKGGYAKFTGLKTYNKNLKTMLAIGGWNEGSSRFSSMVADPNRRKELVKNSVKFLRQNHFDGLDLDWEYPSFRDGGKPRDKNNYADLVQELREEFERESSKTGRPRLLLSMAIPAGIEYLEKGYDLPKLNEYLDFFNLLSYDYHSAFEPSVNHHAPLYGLEEDNEYNFDAELTIDFTMNYLLKHDVSSDKIVLGIPTYGRSYTLINDESTEIGSPAEGPGEEGDATREKGYLAYYEICENIDKSNDWEVVQPNSKAMGPYAFKGNQWVGYDDENIVRIKALYAIEKKLGGIMFWSIDNDDFRGKCHGRPYPLIEAAKETLLTGNIKGNQSVQKTKTIVNQKKIKNQTNNKQTDDEEIVNRKSNSNQKKSNKIHPTRKRIVSRPNDNKAKSRDRGQIDQHDNSDSDEQVNDKSNKNHVKTRTRSRSSNRRKEQKKNEQAESSDSNKLTTPEPPTTPDPGSDFKCEDEGFFSHPRDCKKYFWCLDSGPGGLGVVAHAFTCPSGLVFNKAADSCDYPRNVICPKANTAATTTTTTTKAPTTRRTTTTTPESISNEEEEDDEELEDDDINTAEEIDDEVPVSTTSKPHQYKTINRSRPTTTSSTTTTDATTTTETQTITTIPSRILKTNEKEFNFEDEEDPRVIKELIDLIKKAGGLEQLEKQLNYQGKDKAEGNDKMTPATITRSLYERVLSRQATRFSGSFGVTSPRTTTTTKLNTVQNAPGNSQFEGLDDIPEVKSRRRIGKPQYVTIERQKTTTVYDNSDDEKEDTISDEKQQDNDDVASTDDSEISNLPDHIENQSSTKKVSPSYVNIRRSRPTTPANENDLDGRNESRDETPSKFLSQERYDNIESEDSISKEEEEEVMSKEQPVQKSRYKNTHNFRSTTLKSSESSVEDIKPVNESPIESTSLEPEISKNQFISIVQSTTIPTSSTEEFILTSMDSSEEKISVTEPSVQLVDNSVTEILLTTLPVLASTKSTTLFKSSTSPVNPSRPYGVSRRGRPTTTTSTTIQPSYTESSRTKIPTFIKNNRVLLRRPASLIRPSASPIKIGHTLDERFSSRIDARKTDKYFDENSRVQELADPSTVTSTFQTGKDTSTRERDDQKSQFIETIFVPTEPTIIMRTTTSSPKPIRQRQKTIDAFDKINQPLKPRQAAIIDYDYYVDEDSKLSLKPELKNKIYITPVGRIGCLDQGTFAHPTSCKKFITCTQMANKKITPTEYTCPANLSFDPVGGICNWSAGIGCNNH